MDPNLKSDVPSTTTPQTNSIDPNLQFPPLQSQDNFQSKISNSQPTNQPTSPPATQVQSISQSTISNSQPPTLNTQLLTPMTAPVPQAQVVSTPSTLPVSTQVSAATQSTSEIPIPTISMPPSPPNTPVLSASPIQPVASPAMDTPIASPTEYPTFASRFQQYPDVPAQNENQPNSAFVISQEQPSIIKQSTSWLKPALIAICAVILLGGTGSVIFMIKQTTDTVTKAALKQNTDINNIINDGTQEQKSNELSLIPKVEAGYEDPFQPSAQESNPFTTTQNPFDQLGY